MGTEELVERINRRVTDGETTWEELGFTSADVNARLRQSRVTKGQYYYGRFLEAKYSEASISEFESFLFNLVAAGRVTWRELGFSWEQVKERGRQARVRNAKTDFQKMLDPHFSNRTLQYMANTIRAMVDNKITTWEELHFTNEDLRRREYRNVPIR